MGLDAYFYLKDKVTEEVIEYSYYRKFNALQGYFVRNHNILNCGRVQITSEILSDLSKNLNKIRNNPEKANVLLPVFHGPFFGYYEYDDLYFSFIHRCSKDLFHAKFIDYNRYDLYYSSDW